MQADPIHQQLAVITIDDVEYEKWGIVDADGNRITWLTKRDPDSSADVIEGTLRNEGGASNTPAPTTPATFAPVKGDASHVYLGTDSRGDRWQVTDKDGAKISWAVRPGDDSRNVIDGSVVRDAPRVATVANPQGGLGAATNAPAPAVVSNPPPNVVNPSTSTGAAVAPAYYDNAPAGNAGNLSRVQGNAAHRYAGSDATRDFWELTDSDGSVVRWAVLLNRDSREIIDGSIVRVGGTTGTTSTRTNGGASGPGASGPVAGGTGGGGVSGTVTGTNSVSPSVVNFVHPVSKASGSIPSSWRRAGTLANGDPVFALVDADGATKTFALDANFQSYWTNGAAGGGLANTPSTSLPTVAAATDGKAVIWVGLGVAALKALVLI